MTHIRIKHKITELTEDDISRRMRKDKLYYHCCGCGGVYEDRNKLILICNLKELNGGNTSISRVFNDYNITSGFCEECYKKVKMNLDEKLNLIHICG